MAFLDNSGDIILDAVLTDEGRRRLAMGDGSFRITKFALGDDEVDYSLYDVSPASGSGYQDTRILQLPVFEAFTNNTTSLKNKLLSYRNNNLLYLPVIKLNNLFTPTAIGTSAPVGGYYVSVDQDTTVRLRQLSANAAISDGCRFANPQSAIDESRIILDQGVDTQALSLGYLWGGSDGLDENIYETAYMVELDSRLLSVATPAGDQGQVATPRFIDDDNIASYYFPVSNNSPYFAQQTGGNGGSAQPSFSIDPGGQRQTVENSVIGPTSTTGRLGSRLVFLLRSSLNLQNSTELFTRLGGTQTINIGAGDTFNVINTVMRVTGFSTGYRVEVPLKLLKYTS
tara:strand:- start:3457 stop:4482 length:1026 start_codon:yes stop_codon:yes gene_type:complete